MSAYKANLGLITPQQQQTLTKHEAGQDDP